MLSLRDDALNGKLYICLYGQKLAFGFRGSPEFTERWSNFAHNRSVIGPRAETHWLLYPLFGYVVVDSQRGLLQGLASQFRSEIIMKREIPPLREGGEEENWDIGWDEKKVGELATQRAQEFFDEFVIQEDFMKRIETTFVPAYEVAEVGGEQGEE